MTLDDDEAINVPRSEPAALRSLKADTSGHRHGGAASADLDSIACGWALSSPCLFGGDVCEQLPGIGGLFNAVAVSPTAAGSRLPKAPGRMIAGAYRSLRLRWRAG